MTKLTSLLIAAACTALFATGAFAADKPMTGMDMKAKPAAMTTKPKMKHKMSCYDYAWESQSMKDCQAKQDSMKMAKPMKPMKTSAKKAPAKKMDTTKKM